MTRERKSTEAPANAQAVQETMPPDAIGIRHVKIFHEMGVKRLFQFPIEDHPRINAFNEMRENARDHLILDAARLAESTGRRPALRPWFGPSPRSPSFGRSASRRPCSCRSLTRDSPPAWTRLSTRGTSSSPRSSSASARPHGTGCPMWPAAAAGPTTSSTATSRLCCLRSSSVSGWRQSRRSRSLSPRASPSASSPRSFGVLA